MNRFQRLFISMSFCVALCLHAEVDFELINEGRIIARDGKNTGHPSVIRIPEWIHPSKRANKQAKYYMYYGNHYGSCILMKWAESLSGNWKKFDLGGRFNGKNRCGVLDIKADSTREDYDHIAHPDAVVDHGKKRILLFVHGRDQPPQTTKLGQKIPQRHGQFLATSGTGLNFNDPKYAGGEKGHGFLSVKIHGLVREIGIAAPYQRVFIHGGQWYSVSKRGILYKAPDPEDPFAANPNNPLENVWIRADKPTPLWVNDAHQVQPKYFSPVCAFTASSEFANHPNNPVKGRKILCETARVNHVGIDHHERENILELLFYVKLDDNFQDLYRVVYDISLHDFKKWDVKRSKDNEVMFDVYLRAESIYKASEKKGLFGFNILRGINYLDPMSMGTSFVFNEGGEKYLFFSYVSQLYGGNEGEGQIGAVLIKTTHDQ